MTEGTAKTSFRISPAEIFCLVLLWLGTVGMIASVSVPEMQVAKLNWVCEFSAVILFGLVVKLVFLRDSKAHPSK